MADRPRSTITRSDLATPAIALLGIVVLLALTGPGSASSASSGPANHGSDAGAAAGPLPGGRPTSPAASFGLNAPGLSPVAISLQWNQSGSIFFQNYTISVSNVSATGPFRTAGIVTSQSSTQFAVDALSPGATYWWMVTAYNLGGSTASNVLAETQPALAFLSGGLLSSTVAELNWTDSSTYGGLLSFHSFTILQKNTSTGPFTPVATITSASARTFNVSGLSPGGSYAFYLNTTDCLGCGSAAPQPISTASNALSVGTPFPLSVSVAAARTLVDIGQPDLFLCTASGGQPSYRYDWSVNGSTFSLGNSTLSHAFDRLGPSSVQCKVTDQLSAVANGGTSVTVSTAPTLQATVNRSSADVGQPVAFACSVSGGTSPASPSWTFGDGNGLDAGSATHAYASAGSFSPTCFTTDGAGVTATTSVAVNVSLALTTTLTSTSSSAAPGTILDFTAQPENGSGTYTAYAWTFGDQTSGVGAAAQHAFAAPGDFTVSLRVSDSNGVTATASMSVQVSWIVVHQLTLPTSGTAGNEVNFSASATGGAGGTYNYTWSFGDGTNGYGAVVLHRYASAGSFHPSLTVHDRLGAANTTVWPSLVVSAAPTALSSFPVWSLLVVAAIVGAILTLLMVMRSRGADHPSPEALSRWVPPFGTQETARGAKVCPSCGTANAMLRRSCQVCGASLPLAPNR